MNDPTNATRGTSLNTSRLCVFALLFVVLAVFCCCCCCCCCFFFLGGGVKTLLLRRVHHNESPKGLAPPSWIAVKIGKV